jgi:hypothetical protein
LERLHLQGSKSLQNASNATTQHNSLVLLFSGSNTCIVHWGYQKAALPFSSFRRQKQGTLQCSALLLSSPSAHGEQSEP